MMRATVADPLMASEADWATRPRTNPKTASDAAQAMTTGRLSRTARPAGPVSNAVRAGGASGAGRALAPRSRAPASAMAAATSTTTRVTIGTNASGLGET